VTKKWIITLVALGVGALHFLNSENYPGLLKIFVNGYLIDILLPMVLFLLLGLFENRFVRPALFRVCLVFGFACIVETSQNYGFPIFGSTFDPLDILAYAVGVGLGVLLDLVLFPQFVPRWNEQTKSGEKNM
jgi:hypothetical protein